jgi:hypothetical protein
MATGISDGISWFRALRKFSRMGLSIDYLDHIFRKRQNLRRCPDGQRRYKFNFRNLDVIKRKEQRDKSSLFGKRSLRKRDFCVKKERVGAGYENLVGKNLISLDKDRQIAYYKFFNKSNGFWAKTRGSSAFCPFPWMIVD